MSTRDLLEQASLDALGLLDEQEREEFEAAFRAASPEVQAHVRREQLRFADLDHLLPDTEAPAGLRARVVAAVREAIAAVSTPRGSQGSLARIGPAPAVRGLSTAPIWRAACIGFATATVVLSLFYIWIVKETRDISSLMTSDQIAEYLQQNAGPDAAELLASAGLRQYALVPAAADYQGVPLSAQLFVDVEQGEALLFCKGLPQINGTYQLVIESADGLKKAERFQHRGSVVPVRIGSVDVTSLSRVVIEGPTGDGEGEVLRFEGT